MGGGGGGGDERVKARPRISERPWTATRTMEVLRRCPLSIAQRLVHCAIAVSTAVFGQSQSSPETLNDPDDDVGLHVLGCRVDILGTNCKKDPSFFHVALRPRKRDGLLGTGTEWEGDERVKGSTAETARKRPERPWTAARTMEVLRRCPLAIAQRCCFNCCAGQSH